MPSSVLPTSPLRVSSLLLAAVILLFFSAPAADAGGSFLLPSGKGSVSIYGGSGSAEGYYNADGHQQRFDTLQTSFVATTFGITADYGVMDGLELNAELPFGYFRIHSKERFPDRSIFAPVWLGLGGTYQITSGSVHTSVSTMLKIPPGFHQGIYDDPNHPTFLSDGYFQATTAAHVGVAMEETWLKGSVAYNWRDEEPLDEVIINAEVGFSRVEGTGVFVAAQGVLSTGDVAAPARAFYAGAAGSTEAQQRIDGGTGKFLTIDRENYLAISAGAFVSIGDDLSINGRYNVRLLGTNTLALQGAFLGLGYRF